MRLLRDQGYAPGTPIEVFGDMSGRANVADGFDGAAIEIAVGGDVAVALGEGLLVDADEGSGRSGVLLGNGFSCGPGKLAVTSQRSTQAAYATSIMRDWHRIFGMSLAVTVTGRPFRVIQELELSQIRQRLDVALVLLGEADLTATWPDLPDGLTDLAHHNLISFKSIRETLTAGAMLELVSHAVTYAKQEWRDDWETPLLRRESLLAMAVATHHPSWLKPDSIPGQRLVSPGVYEVSWLSLPVRVILPREVPRSPRNALWHLLSGDAELVAYGLQHCNVGNSMLYNVLNDLRDIYSLEGMEMPYTIDDYRREVMRENVVALTPEELDDVLNLVPYAKRLKGVPVNERLKDVPVEERLKDVPVEERLKDLPVDQIEAWLKANRVNRRPSHDNPAE